MLVWLACRTGAPALRLAVAAVQRRSRFSVHDDPVWLRRLRIALLVHGLIWAWAGGAQPFIVDGELHFIVAAWASDRRSHRVEVETLKLS